MADPQEAELAREISLLKDALFQVTAALVATRQAVNIIANQPTLLLSKKDRAAIYDELQDSVNNVEKVLHAIERMRIADGMNN